MLSVVLLRVEKVGRIDGWHVYMEELLCRLGELQ